jgi:gliding motility-associated-like protein
MKNLLAKAMLGIAVLCQLDAFAQNELWYFGGWPGNGEGVYFNGASINTRDNESTIFYYESATTVSDGAGNPLFYSNGTTVYDQSHAIMSNGSSLMGSAEPGGAEGSGAQGVVAINAPGNSNKYYLLTTGAVEQLQQWGGTNNGLRYHEVDMSAQGNGAPGNPYGAVTAKNQLLIDGITTPMAEMLAAIAGSCDTIWAIAHGANNNTFYAFAITSAGINTTPVTSSLGPTLSSVNWDWARGTISFSPQGDRLAMASGFGLHLFDFNKQSGKVSNAKAVDTQLPYYGSEFSPDGQKIYYTQYITGAMYQYNICTNAIQTVDLSASYFGELVSAPNGKIYCPYNGSNQGVSIGLAEIGNPNGTSAATWNYSTNAHSTGTGVGPGLPQMYFTPEFLNNGPVQVDVTRTLADTLCSSASSTCLGLYVTPAVAGNWRSEPAGFVDSHGVFDPSVNAQDTTVVKIFFGMEPCVKEDSTTIVVINCCKLIGTNPPAGSICPKDSIDLSAMVTDGVGTWTIFQKPAGVKTATIASPWFKTNLKTDPGTYKVSFKLNNQNAGCKDTTIENIVVKAAPAAPAILNVNLCAGDSTNLSAGDANYTYLWHPGGATSSSIKVKTSGKYAVSKTSIANDCLSIDTISVSAIALPVGSIADSSVCAGGSISISAGQWLSYKWDNATSSSSATLSTTGKHWVIVEGNNHCKDTIFVQVNAGLPLNVSLNAPGDLCAGASLDLIATVSGVQAAPLTYLWNNNAGGASHNISTPALHQLAVTDARNCKGSASVTIKAAAAPEFTLGKDSALCFAEGALYKSTVSDTFSSVLWMNNSNASSIEINSAQSISVTVSNGACSKSDTVQITEYCTPLIWDFPNVITPNGDGKNDKFIPFFVNDTTLQKLKKIYFIVYDRWGIKMYENPAIIEIPTWDGKYNGDRVAPGVYYYVVRWTDTSNQEGEKTGYIQLL